MIDATDLTTNEVRTQYVQPLIKQILAKTNLNAATLGIKTAPNPNTSTESEKVVGDEGVIGTLYQEIELYKGELLESNDVNPSTRENNKSYTEILEEAAALSAYLTREEQTLVATVASSALVSFLIPQCDYLNFLHSYFPSTSGTASSRTSAHTIGTLEERLTNAMIWNQDSTIKGGSVFPYSASRMRTTGDDNDDGFTTAYFYRFLNQGLASYLSCGMVFCSNKAVIRKQACNDIVQLISMAICPVTPQNNVKSKSEAGSSSVKETSLLPLSFQLSHLDRLQILRVCKELKMSYDITANDQTALAQLRESLIGFASYVAHSDEEAATAYEALVNASLNEKDESVIQAEFQRLLQTLVESMSSCIINSTGLCIQEMILKYTGNKTKLYLFALRLLAKHFDEEMSSVKNTKQNSSNASTSDEENVAKRHKRSPDNCKSTRLIAILKAAGVLSTGGGLQSASTKRDIDFKTDATIKQMIQNATILLQCSADDQLIVQSASDFLALVLSHETSYLLEKSNIKHIFIHVRQSLLSVKDDNASDVIIDALKPLIVICSRQSGTFAISFLSFVVKTYSAQERVLWKLATYVSIGNPLAASKRLSNMSEASSDESIATCKMRTFLSSSGASASDTLQHSLSLAESIRDMWVLFKLVRVAFQTSNYAFACAILEKRLVCGCSRQQSFMYLNALTKLARGEEVLVMKGAKGVAESLELLSSCNSMLTSLAALEQNSKFEFQLEFIRLRLDTLNLITIARSLSVEILMTEGTLSSKNNRSTLFRNNIGKIFGLLVSRYEKMYRLWGLHRCQQTRSTLRTLQAMCQLLSEFTKLGSKEAKKSTATTASTPTSKSAAPKYDQNQSMNMTLSKLRDNVLEQIMKKPKQKDHSVSLASGLVIVLDAILKCPCPFPSGFFQMKHVPRAIVNISADPNILQDGDHDLTIDAKSRAEIIDVVPGLATKVILSGWLPDKFIQTADVAISEIIAWANLHYEGQLYEEDDAVDSDVGAGNDMTVGVGLDGGGTAGSTSLLAAGKFIMPISFEPLLQDGYYKVNIELGCRDVRGGEWKIPTSSPLEVIFRVDDEGII